MNVVCWLRIFSAIAFLPASLRWCLIRNPALQGRAIVTKPATRADSPHPQPLAHWHGRGERKAGR